MNIGEQIIAVLVEKQELQPDWSDSATIAQIEAVVESHIEERVRVRLELDRQAKEEKLNELKKQWENSADYMDLQNKLALIKFW